MRPRLLCIGQTGARKIQLEAPFTEFPLPRPLYHTMPEFSGAHYREDTSMTTITLSPSTTALLDAADATSDASLVLDFAGHIQRLATQDPDFHRAVRTARACADTTIGVLTDEPGAAELLAHTDAALALMDAHTRMLDAVCAADDFLLGEGLPGLPRSHSA
ncbi:MAG: hypothetical protein ACYCS8_04840 [Acidithiobacillus sp.]